VVVEEVRHADVEVPMPTSEVRFVGQALGTFIVWPTHLKKAISKIASGILSSFLFMLFKLTLNVVQINTFYYFGYRTVEGIRNHQILVV